MLKICLEKKKKEEKMERKKKKINIVIFCHVPNIIYSVYVTTKEMKHDFIKNSCINYQKETGYISISQAHQDTKLNIMKFENYEQFNAIQILS